MTTERITDEAFRSAMERTYHGSEAGFHEFAQEAQRARRVEQEQAELLKRLAENELANGGKVWGRAGWHTYYCHARRQCDDNCRLTQELLRAAGLMVEPEGAK